MDDRTSCLLELHVKVFSDRIPEQGVNSVYGVAQTDENAPSVIGRVADLPPVTQVLLLGSHGGAGYSGLANWEERLANAGVDKTRILAVPIHPAEQLNTYTEARAVVRFAREREIPRLGIVAAPFHQVRAVMTFVSVTLRENPGLALYSIPGSPLPWREVVTHSQGVLRGAREEFIHSELERIERYTAKGDLLPADEILTYLKRRDTPHP